MTNVKVILADDHVIVRNGIKALLENEPNIEVIAEASSGQEALELVGEFHPDILIIDIRMPGMSGLEATSKLKNYSEKTRALILSMHDTEEYVLQSIRVGASGYLLKDDSKEEFLKAIDSVSSGDKYFSSSISKILVNNYLNSLNNNDSIPEDSAIVDLTKKEKDIINLVSKGYSNKKIASHFENSIRTIEAHRFNIMKKLKVKNAIELVKYAIDNKIIDPPVREFR